MKYYIVQNEAQRQTTDFTVIKVKDIDEDNFFETLEVGTTVLVEASSLMEALVKFETAMAKHFWAESAENASNIYAALF